MLYAAEYLILSFVFLTVSNCWTQWVLADNSWKLVDIISLQILTIRIVIDTNILFAF